MGTLITLEKVIPLKKWWLFLFPLISAFSVVTFFAGAPSISFLLLILAGLGLSLVFFLYLKRERSIIYALSMGGSLCWTIGNTILLVKNSYPTALPWWMAFVLLIITAERIELMKFLPVSQRQKYTLVLFLLMFLIGAIASFHGIGRIFCSTSLIMISVWLLKHDVIGISIKKEKLTRFVAISLLCGYAMLLLTGVLLFALQSQALGYDILVHTFFIGFSFSMIFAHGPIIFPGVLGISGKPYHPIFYGWVLLLHLSLGLRIVAGLQLEMQLRKWSGILSMIAILGYIITLAITIYRQRTVKQR